MKVLVSDKLSSDGVNKLKNAGLDVDVITGLTEDELIQIIPQYEALIVRSETKVTPKVIAAAKAMKIIARAGVGVDNIDLPSATKAGIIVVNSPEGNTVAAAEHTIAMMLSMARNIPAAQASLKSGRWDRSKFVGVEVFNKTLGVVGLGKIGSRVASIASGMGMHIIAYDPFVTPEYAKQHGIEIKNLDDVLKSADFITFHIPKTPETFHLINKNKFAIMKKGVRIINCARGGIIDENDLAEALKSGQVTAAAIDVYEKEPTPPDNPLLALDNVVCVPHLGASTVEAQVNVAIDVVDQVIDVSRGEPARAAVNIPAMKPAVLAKVKPFMPLCEKIGKVCSQLASGSISGLEITYQGEVSNLDTSPLTIAVLKGIFDSILEYPVNFVNAPIVAKERGLKVVESKTPESPDFANLITVTIKSENGCISVGGTTFSGFGDRIVRIDEFTIDMELSGYMLIATHTDKPGIIGSVGTILGKNKINIAGMDVGRQSIGGKAVMVLTVDTSIPESVISEITKTDGISTAKLVKL